MWRLQGYEVALCLSLSAKKKRQIESLSISMGVSAKRATSTNSKFPGTHAPAGGMLDRVRAAVSVRVYRWNYCYVAVLWVRLILSQFSQRSGYLTVVLWSREKLARKCSTRCKCRERRKLR